MSLVLGVDSSTQACKVVIRDSETGKVVRTGRAAHPAGTEIDPERWWQALQQALSDAGGIDDVASISIAAQQHGLICLDERGDVVRPALLWNDTRSAPEAAALVAELSAAGWAQAVGSVPLASFTVSKLRWVAEHDEESARHTEAVCLPHDWLTWRLRHALSGTPRRLDTLTTDRSDASGTGYYSPMANAYRLDLIERAFGRRLALPRVLAPADPAGCAGRAILGAGLGDNAAAALALCTTTGDVVVSLGTSGTVFTRVDVLTPDDSGTVAGFADATGHYLPLVCTLNGTRVLDAVENILSVDHAGLSALALSAPQGADGLVLLPYFAGERTPNLPTATGTLFGLRDKTSTPADLARAAVEGVLCGLADALDALVERGIHCNRLLLIGGGARLPAVRTIAPSVFRRSVFVPPPSEYVADGAALQALWALNPAHQPAPWGGDVSARFFPESDRITVHAQYRAARYRVLG